MKELVELLTTALNMPFSWLVILTLVSGLIEISPIKLNPWTAIKEFFTANKRILARLDDIENRIEQLEKNDKVYESKHEEEKAIDARIRILHFGDQILHKKQHTKEHYEQTMRDIKYYEKYCKDHPEFENDVTVTNIAIIKETYEKCLKGEKQFLPYYTN